MIVATTKGIGPDGRGYLVGSELEQYRESDPQWLDAVLRSGGALDDAAMPNVPPGQLAGGPAGGQRQEPTVVAASAVMQREFTTKEA